MFVFNLVCVTVSLSSEFMDYLTIFAETFHSEKVFTILMRRNNDKTGRRTKRPFRLSVVCLQRLESSPLAVDRSASGGSDKHFLETTIFGDGDGDVFCSCVMCSICFVWPVCGILYFCILSTARVNCFLAAFWPFTGSDCKRTQTRARFAGRHARTERRIH